MLCASFFSVTGRDSGLNPSLSGLVLSYSLTVVNVMNWAVRTSNEVCCFVVVYAMIIGVCCVIVHVIMHISTRADVSWPFLPTRH